MLTELAVRDLGIIAELRLVFGEGMTAVGGETGAGKTLLVQAIELLVGGRADPLAVRSGADEAYVEGRFSLDGVGAGTEVVLARVVPRTGRSRSYVDGRMAVVADLARAGAGLVDLHGQHRHHSLLSPAAQRSALDHYGGADLGPLRAARHRVGEVVAALAALGGDDRARVRELDLVAFQVAELGAAGLLDPEEDATLAREEDRLADATAHRQAAAAAHAALADDGGAVDKLGAALGLLAGRGPLVALAGRLRALATEADDVASELRAAAEALEDDPERLAAIRVRRALLHDLRRKYGATLAEVMVFADEAGRRLAELSAHAPRVQALEAHRRRAVADLVTVEAEIAGCRREAAPRLADAVASHLGRLALPGARFEVRVGPVDPGDDVSFWFGANTGEPPRPLARVASGGELARTMLA
ncbi:MAG: AAA family ATPase, partial [Acidimicrobiales bacterium]